MTNKALLAVRSKQSRLHLINKNEWTVWAWAQVQTYICSKRGPGPLLKALKPSLRANGLLSPNRHTKPGLNCLHNYSLKFLSSHSKCGWQFVMKKKRHYLLQNQWSTSHLSSNSNLDYPIYLPINEFLNITTTSNQNEDLVWPWQQ